MAVEFPDQLTQSYLIHSITELKTLTYISSAFDWERHTLELLSSTYLNIFI